MRQGCGASLWSPTPYYLASAYCGLNRAVHPGPQSRRRSMHELRIVCSLVLRPARAFRMSRGHPTHRREQKNLNPA